MTGASEGIGRGYALEVSACRRTRREYYSIDYLSKLVDLISPHTYMYIYSQLARQGLNVVIMSRSRVKLQKVADEISMLLTNLRDL